MRKRIWIPCAIIVAACLLLLLFTPFQPQRIVQPEAPEVVSDSPVQPNGPAVPEPQRLTNTVQAPPLPASASPLAKAIAATNRVAGMRLALWQGPIEFYGKVVDENSNAVAGAQVRFHWVEIPTEDGNRTTNTESDAEGLFSLRDALGPSLNILVSKEGYYPTRGAAQYGSTAISEHSPDPQNPVIFHLRRKGQGVELITSATGMRLKVPVRVPRDNTPVQVDLLHKQASASGKLEIAQSKPPGRATEWSFRLSIPSGGLVENEDQFQFEAPEAGYLPTVEYHFRKNETNWTVQVSKQYYITFGDPPRYGWLRFESSLDQETVFLSYAINPSGSRNLEPIERKPPLFQP